MCLAASGTYFWNDALDIESDREHPTKRFRPIAAGRAERSRTANVVGTMLRSCASALAAATGRWQTVAIVALYMAVTLTYSAIWKHVAVIDLVAIASGFVLRAAAGAVAVDVPMSSWFVLCTTFGSLFIVTGKRFAESRELGDDAHRLRSTLGDYSEGFLQFVLALACGGALVSYCMWAFERRELGDADLPLLRVVDRADADCLPALRAGPRAGPRGGAGRGVRQRPCAAGAGRDLGDRVRARGVRVSDAVSATTFDEAWAAVADVEGWMTRDQGEALDAAARRCPPAGTIVEIGSFQGRSTIVLALAAPPRARGLRHRPARRQRPRPRGDQRATPTPPTPTTPPSTPTWRRAGVADRVTHLRMFSDAALDAHRRADRRALHRRRPPLRTGAGRHPRLGRDASPTAGRC